MLLGFAQGHTVVLDIALAAPVSHCQNKTQLDVITIERNQLKVSNKNFEKSLK
jgi:hypothetical protein